MIVLSKSTASLSRLDLTKDNVFHSSTTSRFIQFTSLTPRARAAQSDLIRGFDARAFRGALIAAVNASVSLYNPARRTKTPTLPISLTDEAEAASSAQTPAERAVGECWVASANDLARLRQTPPRRLARACLPSQVIPCPARARGCRVARPLPALDLEGGRRRCCVVKQLRARLSMP
jgi:hypothetical protein